MSEFVLCPLCGGSRVDDVSVEEQAPCPLCRGAGLVAPATPLVDVRALADGDQSASDGDQTWADHDQTASDRDQRSAEDDQHAADADFAAGGDPRVYEQTSSARKRTSADRVAASRLRDETAEARVRTAADRDRAAEQRDRAADLRDALGRLSDIRPDASRGAIALRAERDRARAAADRTRAADDRLRAAADRAEAARDRVAARRRESDARRELVAAALDELTGALGRRFGLESVSRELERAVRTGNSLVLAFIDVDNLKGVNDMRGHLAGDRLLHLVASTLRAHVRSYDVIVRYGGDEFLCAMPQITRGAARQRMEKTAAALTAADEAHSVSFGIALVEPADGLEELVGRADEDLLRSRRRATEDRA